MTSIEKIAGLSQAQEKISDLVAEWQYAVAHNPEEFKDPIARLAYMHLALGILMVDEAHMVTNFMDRSFDELGEFKTPRVATLQSADGFRLALGCLAM